MAVAFDNSKHDIQLNGVPYRISGYSRSELSTFIPRLGAGEQRESQFDLLRSSSLKEFSGGELQRQWVDDTSAYGIEGLINKYDDGVLYPVNGLESDNGEIYGNTKPNLLCWVRSSSYLFTAYTSYSSPTTCAVIRYDSSGTATLLTLPASISNALIVDMVIKDNQLWITTNSNTAMGYMALSSTTVTAITGGSGYLGSMVVYRGSLYGMGSSTSNILYRYTGSTSTRSFEQVGDIGKGQTAGKCLVYNNRIIITRNDGLYAYDGVQVVTIEDQKGAENTYNYYKAEVLKGYLYYFMPDGYYRFNGSLIEKLYDVSEVGFPVDTCNGDNKIWFVYSNADTLSSRFDKTLGYDYDSTGNLGGRVSYFDGKGMFTYDSFLVGDKDTITEDFAGQGLPNGIIHFNNQIWVTTNMTKTFDNLFKSKTTAPTNSSVQIITSIFDAEFPQIFKSLEELEMSFDGDTSVATVFTVEARTETTVGGFEGSGGWVTVATFTLNANTAQPIWVQRPTGLQFKKIQFKITATQDLGTGIEKFIIRYTLQPEYKSQWQFTCLCYGDQDLSLLQLQDKTEDTITPATLRGNIYASRESNFPVSFLDVDSITLNASLSNVALTATIVSGDADVLKADEGFLQIDTEIVWYERDTATSLVLTRAQLGTTATSHSSGAKFYPYYRTIVRTIQNERIELTDEELVSTATRTRDSEITITLQEV